MIYSGENISRQSYHIFSIYSQVFQEGLVSLTFVREGFQYIFALLLFLFGFVFFHKYQFDFLYFYTASKKKKAKQKNSLKN